MSKQTHQIVDEIISAWDLDKEINGALLRDVEYAITEAYMLGAYNASKDKELLDEATRFVENLQNNPQTKGKLNERNHKTVPQ